MQTPKFDIAWYKARVLVNPETSCWDWQKSCTTRGYPQMWKPQSTDRYAHRHIWRLLNGEIPSNYEVMHVCDNPKCVNPEHLVLGTHRENMHDMISKNRDRKACGSAAGKAKLSDLQVAEIRAFPAGFNQHLIAKQYGVTASTIWHIINKRTWSNT